MAEEIKLDEPNFNQKNVEDYTALLKKVVDDIAALNTLFSTLSSSEQAVAGGIVFNLHSDWITMHMTGVIVNRPVGSMLINQLVGFFNNPPQKNPLDQPIPGIIPARSGGNGQSN